MATQSDLSDDMVVPPNQVDTRSISSKDQTLTPLSLLKLLGEFDLDPCGYPGHETAKKIICLPEDGLGERWSGMVWVNPPYSNPGPWLAKLKEHGEGIALVLASTDTRWFHDYILDGATCIRFLKGRPKFLNNRFEPVSLMRATLLVGYGQQAEHRLIALPLGKFVNLHRGTDLRLDNPESEKKT